MVVANYRKKNKTITNGEGNFDEMLLSPSLKRFTNQHVSTFIGADTVPALSGGVMVSPVRTNVNRSLASYSAGINACLHLSVKGAKGYDNYVETGNHALFIPNGDICGFRLRTRRISSSQTLSSMDSVILCVNSNDVSLTLPTTNLQGGHILFIRKCDTGNITLVGRILRGWENPESSVYLEHSILSDLVYDLINNFWTCNVMD